MKTFTICWINSHTILTRPSRTHLILWNFLNKILYSIDSIDIWIHPQKKLYLISGLCKDIATANGPILDCNPAKSQISIPYLSHVHGAVAENCALFCEDMNFSRNALIPLQIRIATLSRWCRLTQHIFTISFFSPPKRYPNGSTFFLNWQNEKSENIGHLWQ